MIQKGTDVRDALHSAATALSAAGVESPRLDAEVLLADALGVSRESLHSGATPSVQGGAVRTFQDAVRRRAVLREPVAYITGRRHFRALELHADRRALIPRPESEHLVELSLQAPAGARVLDVCTGSGAVALALKSERPDLEVWGSDISEDALDLAGENAAALALEVTWVRSDLLERLDDSFDVVVANPPYVAEHDRAALAPEITRHEPALALFAGDDGLGVVSRLFAELAGRTRAEHVYVEVGVGQSDAVQELALGAGFASVRAAPDLAGIPRVVIAERCR